MILIAAPTAAIADGVDYETEKPHPTDHGKGQKGTPFSRCVVAAAQVKKQNA
jgi:hypothetical protein